MSNCAEVIIIGGGVIGCATAYYLAKEGTSVIVLEGSDHIGNGGSSRNGGGVRQSGRDPRELPLAMYGIRTLWPHCRKSWRRTVNTIRTETCVSGRRKSTERYWRALRTGPEPAAWMCA